MNNCYAVYIHIPFCSNICSYCDFCKIYYKEDLVYKYLDALEDEISKSYNDEIIKTIYIGGGTPSCLNLNQLNKLLNIIKIFKFDKTIEFTFECNINDLDSDKLEVLYLNNVNRLSIGVQTFNQKYLSFLNRKHTKNEIKEKIELAKKIGFNNVNVDLIYALPNETIDELKSDLNFFLDLNINHISTYSLILEPNTVLGINNIEPISEEVDYEMYNIICDILKENGFKHYELSNFSKNGFESKHNLTYWNNREYYGFGLGATGYINDYRYTNTKSIKHYLEGKYKYINEKINLNEKLENEMILGLRKIDGVNKKNFYKKYNKRVEDIFKLDELLKKEYLIDDGKNIYINEKYLYVQNSILTYFLGGNYE